MNTVLYSSTKNYEYTVPATCSDPFAGTGIIRDEETLRGVATKGHRVSIGDFETREAAEEFVAKFPNARRAKLGICELHCYNAPNVFLVNFKMSGTQTAMYRTKKTTGDTNESGQRRLDFFVEGLKAVGLLQEARRQQRNEKLDCGFGMEITLADGTRF